MYKRIAVLIVLALLTTLLVSSDAQEAWVARDGMAKNTELKAAIFNKDALYIATKNVLYRTKDTRDKWESVFSIPKGGSNEINCIAGRSKVIFVGTKRGLFRSQDYGAKWENVFKTILPDKNNIVCVDISKHNRSKVLIGTEKGVFLSDDLGENWQNISGALKDVPVKCLALNKELIYAGTQNGLYVIRPGSMLWQRAFVISTVEKNESEEEDIYFEEDEKDMSIRCIAIDDSRVYIAYDKDVLYSDDGAVSWNNFSGNGLKGVVNHILISQKNKKMYCATNKGVFEFSQEKEGWFELYRGMANSLAVSRLIFGDEDENILLALTDKGLHSFGGGDYMMDNYPDINNGVRTLKVVLDGEPTFRELREAAIKYAEVSPEKIKRWRSESKMSALLPKVSLGADRNTTDLWHWETGSSTKTGDDVLLPGQDSVDWGATVSWELGNLIWNDDQTNIDVRSRLTVQLRNDILDDLRRAYYERKRLQFELMSNPPRDMNTKFEKDLRLQELTQAIDDLTGNYFSDHVKQQSNKSIK